MDAVWRKGFKRPRDAATGMRLFNRFLCYIYTVLQRGQSEWNDWALSCRVLSGSSQLEPSPLLLSLQRAGDPACRAEAGSSALAARLCYRKAGPEV